MWKSIMLACGVWFSIATASAQHHNNASEFLEPHYTINTLKDDHDGLYEHPDTATIKSLSDFFMKGDLHGNVRNYFMSTINYGNLSDYYANATGGSLVYHTARWKGFELGLGGLFIYNVFSNDLSAEDSTTGQTSKYELQLFDLKDPDNRTNLDRMEELFINYRWRHSFVQYGKFGLLTPLVNKQDTRMKAYMVHGFWGGIRELKHWGFNFGWLHGATPRSTTHWYALRDAVGIYENGYRVDGEEAQYAHHLNTAGMGIFSAIYQKNQHLKIQLWDYIFDNVSNTLFLQMDTEKKWKNGMETILGLQYLRQDPVGNGGNANAEYRYFELDQRTNVVSARVGSAINEWSLTLNHTYIAGTGRFIFPREMGREQFYTTLSRGRMEGLGNSNTTTAMLHYEPHQIPHFDLFLGYSRMNTPATTDYTLNKYRAMSNDHFILDLRYRFAKILEGLDLRMLYVHKRALNRDLLAAEPELRFNGSDYHHFNLITNIRF